MPDPAIYHQQQRGGDTWYLYCTGDPLNSQDLDANGNPRPHLISQFRSWDLVHWTYIGDAFAQTPAWVGTATAQFWAPAVKFLNGKYHMYYVAPEYGRRRPSHWCRHRIRTRRPVDRRRRARCSQ